MSTSRIAAPDSSNAIRRSSSAWRIFAALSPGSDCTALIIERACTRGDDQADLRRGSGVGTRGTGKQPITADKFSVPQADMTIDTDTQTGTITGQLICDVCSCLRVGRHDAGRGPGG